MAPSVRDERILQFESDLIPCVSIGKPDESQLVSYVDVDNFKLVQDAVNLLAVNGYKFFTNSYRANANWKRYFKMWDSNGKFSLKITLKNWKKNWESLNFAFNHDFQYTQWEGARKRNYDTYKNLSKMKESKGYKKVMKFFDKLKKGVEWFEKIAY